MQPTLVKFPAPHQVPGTPPLVFSDHRAGNSEYCWIWFISPPHHQKKEHQMTRLWVRPGHRCLFYMCIFFVLVYKPEGANQISWTLFIRNSLSDKTARFIWKTYDRILELQILFAKLYYQQRHVRQISIFYKFYFIDFILFQVDPIETP